MSAPLMPHRTIDPDAVLWRDWLYQLEALPLEHLEQVVLNWDYTSTLTFRTQLRFDAELLTSSSDVLSPSCVGAKLTADCPSTSLQISTLVTLPREGENPVELTLSIPPGVAAESVVIARSLVVICDHSAPCAPRGSRLTHPETKRVRVEGEGGRFPVELMSFAGLPYQHAPWVVDVRFDDLDDSYVASTALWVNNDHELKDVLLNPKSKNSAALHTMIQADVFAALLQRLAELVDEDESLAAPESPADDSVWAIASGLARHFLRSDLPLVVSAWREDPLGTQARIRSDVGFLKGLEQ
ncbi:hypothetical protein [Parenemella sanctibonifatiensis]|uniref:Uncharacterized protein n=1 Tax=Parenemella sanctibonifatiensis TaxID=2016505 RepID=A0A255ED66_9ACTN|nr:hypothetical protein [Parenemella sanctibonifatiensis]OYN88861.1 hypothetical protein CGZ92_03935 [Parenemella sanctibonifatiensis]